MVWIKSGTETLTASSDQVETKITAKKFNQVLFHGIATGAMENLERVGIGSIDTGSNYAQRLSANGGADSTLVSQSTMNNTSIGGAANDVFNVDYFVNISDEEKLFIQNNVSNGGTGAANDPDRAELVCKWDNVTGQIDTFRTYEARAGSLDTDSNLTIIGTDGGETIQAEEVRNDHIETLIETDTQERYNLYPEIGRVKQGVPAVGGWVELGRTTLGGAADTITVSSLSNKRYYMILNSTIATGGVLNHLGRFNNDSGTNYARRGSSNGGADGTATSATNMIFGNGGAGVVNNFGVQYVSNLSSNEKLVYGGYCEQSTAGASNAPNRGEEIAKWANTSSAINRVDLINSDTGDYNTGSEVVVLGWDPDDTHSSNFWQPLANVKLGTDSATLDTGIFKNKKYLWIQVYTQGDSNFTPRLYVDNGTINTNSNEIATRRSYNGEADVTLVSQDYAELDATSSTTPVFVNIFMINNLSEEKLGISHSVRQNTAGAGTAPDRRELVFKSANTGNQVNILRVEASTGNLLTNTWIKVWGAD